MSKQDFSTDRIAKPTPEMGEATQQSPALATLVHVVDGVQGQVFPLLAAMLVIGRGRDCHIRISGDTRISRKHATVTRQGVRFMLEDLNSSNGVFVNGVQIREPHELQVDDRVEVGSQVFLFKRRAQ